MLALVLSGGGLFGAWQAGAWSVLARHMEPDLIVGVSVGSLNGYAIAAGATPTQLYELWKDPHRASFRGFTANLRELTAYPLRRPFAVAVTDLLRMKPKLYRDDQITWRHLAASCAVPLAMRQVKLDGRWCSDGGLCNPLPVWAAVELGATRIVGLHAMPTFPARWMGPAVEGFKQVFGYNPPVPAHVTVETLVPGEPLGGLNDALRRREANIERWLEQGVRDAEAGLKRAERKLRAG
jgi:predicted acylesterase/phospholipase RssA